MKHSTIGRIATVSLMLGAATMACTPDARTGHPAALADAAPVKADKIAAREAGKARDALARHKGEDAVVAAEKAVGASPRNADYRMLLGQAYLASGRFTSAETAFRDTLTLAPDQSRASFDLALAQIAQGRSGEAHTLLLALNGTVPNADLGLALVLSGDHEGGIAKLLDAVRKPDATARTRQNLALAYALDGHWREARAMAMQDTPPDRIGDQIAGWAVLANPAAGTNAGALQIASMLGVRPVRDRGMPAALALSVVPTPDVVKPVAPVAVALADPAPVVAAAPVTAPAPSVEVPLAEPTPARPMTPTPVAASTPVSAPIPALVAAETAAHTPGLLRAPTTPERIAFAASNRPLARGRYVVQLGAYTRAGALEAAWAQASRLSPQVATLSPVRSQFSQSGTTLVRLSVGGFADRADAVKLCDRVKAQGGNCFVRATLNDAPLQWAKRETGSQIAMR